MNELEERICQWLLNSGFPLEMRLAGLWEQAAFHVAQSVYYVDPETSTPRETDIVAARENVTGEAWVRWINVVECKSGRDAPWVLFPRRGQPLMGKARILMLSAARSTKPYLSRISRRSDVEQLPLFSNDRVPAYGVVQALKTSQDPAYSATMSVAKAAAAILDEVSETEEVNESLAIVWPLIVTEAPLFEARLGSEGKPEVHPVERGTLLWHHPTAGKGVNAIDIIRADMAESYIAELTAAVELILHNTSTEITATMERRRANVASNQGRSP